MNQLFKDKDQGIKYHGRPAWCSFDLWGSLKKVMPQKELSIEFDFSRAEKKIYRKRKKIKVSEWAERHRILTMSVLPGAWHNDVTPYLTGIMDAAALSFIREVTICKTPQTGGSEAIHNFIGYCIDRDWGPVLYIYPDQKTAEENSKDRVLPMITSAPRLRKYLTPKDKDTSIHRIKLSHMTVFFGWARSVATLANKSIQYAVADEIDKPGFDPGKTETGALELIDKRLTTFRGKSKFIKISTPTLESGNVWKELNAMDIIFDYFVRCPLCDGMQLMKFKGIKWDGASKADPREVKNKNLAWYKCKHCAGKWDEGLRDKAVKKGVWMARGKKISMDVYLRTYRPATIGFHIPAWISYFITFGEIVSAFLLGLDDPIKLQDFKNSYEALPWSDESILQDEQGVLDHCIDLPGGVVPKAARWLTAGIDVQKYGFWFVVRAWFDENKSHLVQYGYFTTWADVDTLIFKTRYPVENGNGETMGISRAGIDSGGGVAADDDWTKTEEVYSYIRRNGGYTAFATKGASKPQATKLKTTVVDKTPGGQKKARKLMGGGLVLYWLNTHVLKSIFWQRMTTDKVKGSDQVTTLHADTGMDYAQQITAEKKEKNRNGVWKWVQIRRDNHLLDCEVIAAACSDPEWSPSLSHIVGSMRTGGKKGKVISKGIQQ